jgi:uncharacterized protein YjbI with pentapeptide repeats
MAKKTAKPTISQPWAPKLAGKTIAFVGKFGYGNRELPNLKAVAESEQARLVDGEKTAPDYLVVGDGVGGKPPSAVAKIQKKHGAVQILAESDFYALTAPTADEFLALLRSGIDDRDFWYKLQARIRQPIDLSGADLRNFTLHYAILYNANLDDADFRGARLQDVCFAKISRAKFDGATLADGIFQAAEDCSLKNVTMTRVRWNPAEFVRCDFTGATLGIECGSYTRATACVFRKVDFTGADLDQSHFQGCDFARSKLAGAQLEKTDFRGADLSGADLTGADLRNVNFANADLRKAKLRDALLSGADLTGANIEGADFAGANLTGVKGIVDPAVAKNVAVTAARTAGPNMAKLATTARGSKKLTASIELDLGPGEFVSLNPSWSTYGSTGYVGATYSHQKAKSTFGGYVDSPSFEQGMLNLVDRWPNGKPRLDSVKVVADKCAMPKPELLELAIAAWHEAIGLPVPTPEERQKQQAATASSAMSLRETMLAELMEGAAGLEKWNARSDRERREFGSLRKHDFSKAHLVGVQLHGLDLRKAKFDEANAKDANFGGSQLQEATFVGAKLQGAWLAGAKTADGTFANADLRGANVRNSKHLRVDFRGADLTGADFSWSDLSGADLSSANLDKVVYAHTIFNEKTLLPPGFVAPKEMIWRGVGVRPGTAPLPKIKKGTLDFDGFVQQLPLKFDAARLAKAVKMLKAERFKLFAEVKPDAVTGVVKSQSSKELVYSCRLTADGKFGCCTQNLNPCGGLRGAPCKHLLVLLIGLAKAGELDPAVADGWLDAAKREKPAIDESAMSETFLKYKGAEAGEIDWRPTETIPEDYYAL